MKSLKELESMLLEEIKSYSIRENSNFDNGYYNDVSGSMSLILTMIFSKLITNNEEWVYGWLDDSLLTNIKEVDNRFCVWGIMIRGKDGTTEQWTDPFYFEIKPNDEFKSYSEYSFLYGEKNNDDVTYTEFNKYRGVWDFGFYSDETWNPSERNWTFILNKKN